MAKRNNCPICGKPPAAGHTPLCSPGCKDRDLLQWLGEGYRIPGEGADPEGEAGVDTSQPGD